MSSASRENNKNYQAELSIPPDLLIVILGPTASGKTSLAIQLAKKLNAEIISADSRQVYKGMDIGTGKDLTEYENVPYHLINILEPGAQYNVAEFQNDFYRTFEKNQNRKVNSILCGGTGLYIESILSHKPYSHIPKDTNLRNHLEGLNREELLHKLTTYTLPANLKIDTTSNKRLIRGIEILKWLKNNELPTFTDRSIKNHILIGLNPPRQLRRELISKRLHERIDNGLLDEVQKLIEIGVSHDKLQEYGLEYKYASLYLLNEISFDNFIEKLTVEIHRYAKRQMTFFRKMEKSGLKINWLDTIDLNKRINISLNIICENRNIPSQ